MSKQPTVTVSDDSYDCHAPSSEWRHGLYLDPEDWRVTFHQQYGCGTPMSVWHGRALIVDLPRMAVGEAVVDIVQGEEFRQIVVALFRLYDGSYWDGSNHVGRWGGDDMERHELEEQIKGLFTDVPTYWSAADWMQASWHQEEADGIRERLSAGESLDDIVEEMVDHAIGNNAHLHAEELLSTLKDLLDEYPAVFDCG